MPDYTSLVTSSLPIQPDKQLELITINQLNQFVKPKLLITTPIAPGDEKKFDNHTPYPTRDNLKLYNGKPVIVNITLESEPYEIATFNDKTKSYEMAKIEGSKVVLTTVLVDVRQNKNIITTAIDGLNGTVKEFISDGDYEISIRGALVNNGTAFPLVEFKKMITLTKAPISVKVTSDYLALFSIHYLTITDISFAQKEGNTNTALFEMGCLSDNAIDVLKINK